MNPVSRRLLLQQAAWLAGAALAPAALAPMAYGQSRDGDDPFTLGVASGDPAPGGFVIWTRLAPKPLEPGGGMPPRSVPLRWEVAEDQSFRRIAARGRVLAGPAAGHAVHVEVAGLKPAREYWYRFRTDGGSSPVGRTRTAPALGSKVESLRFAFASCQKFEAGFYGAYRHMVDANPDLILFLGDYIYEQNPGSPQSVRLHQNPEPFDVDGYRARHATYKSDRLLQAAHQAAPWMVMWDDHEVANDYGSSLAEDQNQSEMGDPAKFLARRAAAYQVYYESMPLRRRSKPVGPDMLLYRSLDWGSLAQFQIVDDRQYRSARACVPATAGAGKAIPDCAERRDPARSILGMGQERWLLDRLANSKAGWNFLAQQTLFVPMNVGTPEAAAWSTDGWDGSPATRDRIIGRWRDAKVANPVVIGGDIHDFSAAEVRAADNDQLVSASFVGGSISSLGSSEEEGRKVMAKNPHIKFHNGAVRGFGQVDVTPAHSTLSFRALADARGEDSPISTLAQYALESGRPGVQPV